MSCPPEILLKNLNRKGRIPQKLSNKRFGNLIAIEPIGLIPKRGMKWLCKCDCGKLVEKYAASLNALYGVKCHCDNGLGLGRKPILKKGEAAFNELYGSYKSKSLKRKIKFELSKEQFKNLTLDNCFYCGDSPTNIQKGRNGDYVYNGIDRVDNNKGYELDNCVSCCDYCNRMKLNYTTLEFAEKISKIYSFFIVKQIKK